jgi:hypothetical protein
LKTFSLVVLTALVMSSAFAQITLNQSSAPTVGQSVSNHSAGTQNFNGTTGSGNMNWDMTSYAFGTTGGIEYIDPATTPFGDSFPTAQVAAGVPGASSWSYMRTAANGLWYLGFGTEIGGGLTNIADVDALMVPFPCTYNTSWSTVIRVTIEPAPGTSYVTLDSTYNVVNAWGNLITPSWTESALRVLGHGFTSAYLNGNQVGATFESYDYQFITANSLRSMTFTNSGATAPGYTTGDLIYTSGGTVDVPAPRGPVSESFKLSQNYPNPFNPTTILPVELAKSAKVDVTIYNEMGQVVSESTYDLSAGQHSLPIDGSAWGSGNYFAKVMAGNEVQTARMVLVK